MRIQELFEQTFAPLPAGQGGAATPTMPSAGGTTPGMTGNVTQLTDPKMQAATLAIQNQQKAATKKSIQDQLTALQKQEQSLQQQLTSLQ